MSGGCSHTAIKIWSFGWRQKKKSLEKGPFEARISVLPWSIENTVLWGAGSAFNFSGALFGSSSSASKSRFTLVAPLGSSGRGGAEVGRACATASEAGGAQCC